jgi:hypothetical protein
MCCIYLFCASLNHHSSLSYPVKGTVAKGTFPCILYEDLVVEEDNEGLLAMSDDEATIRRRSASVILL